MKKLKETILQALPNRLTLCLRAIFGNLSYNQDGLATCTRCDFMQDERFMRAYNLAVAQGLHVRKDIHWRVYTACWAAATARHLGGDFVECGVFKGFVSRIVMEYIGFRDLPQKFYLLDTFEGLVGNCLTNAERQQGRTAGGYGVSFDFVKQVFAGFPNAVLVKGMVPDTLSQIASDKIAYVHLDMNCMAPEVAAAEYLWPRMAKAGMILLDDYGWRGFEEQKRGFDTFARERDVEVLSLPTGQGLIVKPY